MHYGLTLILLRGSVANAVIQSSWRFLKRIRWCKPSSTIDHVTQFTPRD